MKLYLKRLNPFGEEPNDEDTENIELKDLCEFSCKTDYKDGRALPDIEAILDFKEKNITKVRKELEHLEIELPEPEFSMALALLQIIFHEDDEIGEGIETSEEPRYALSWDTLSEASKKGPGSFHIFEVEDIEDIEPSVAVNFFWHTRESKRRDN